MDGIEAKKAQATSERQAQVGEISLACPSSCYCFWCPSKSFEFSFSMVVQTIDRSIQVFPKRCSIISKMHLKYLCQ
jgi:hypothetical protein